jgi:hypothetical protein
MRQHEFRTIVWSVASGLVAAIIVETAAILLIRRAGCAWHGKIFTNEAFNWKDSAIVCLAAAAHALAMGTTATFMRRSSARAAERPPTKL